MEIQKTEGEQQPVEAASGLKQGLGAHRLADALVDWSGGRVEVGAALDLAKRYLNGEKATSLAWLVFDLVVAHDA